VSFEERNEVRAADLLFPLGEHSGRSSPPDSGLLRTICRSRG
jgi:hypothetical protein